MRINLPTSVLTITTIVNLEIQSSDALNYLLLEIDHAAVKAYCTNTVASLRVVVRMPAIPRGGTTLRIPLATCQAALTHARNIGAEVFQVTRDTLTVADLSFPFQSMADDGADWRLLFEQKSSPGTGRSFSAVGLAQISQAALVFASQEWCEVFAPGGEGEPVMVSAGSGGLEYTGVVWPSDTFVSQASDATAASELSDSSSSLPDPGLN
jgi:hypothetical protein